MRDRAPCLVAPPERIAPVPRLALTPRELAEAIGVCERTVATWTAAGIGPPSIRMGRLRLYPVEAVVTWLLDQAREAEAQAAAEQPADVLESNP